MKLRVGRDTAGVLLVHLAFVAVALAQGNRPGGSTVLGRWDVTVRGKDGNENGNEKYPSWFEIRQSGHRTLVGSYVGQFGSARPISKVELVDGTIQFTVPPQWEDRKADVTYKGRLEGEVIRGETTNDDGDRIMWEARRAPSLDRPPPNSWGDPIELFNGQDLKGWKPRHASAKNGWQVRDGVLVNAQPGNDLVTEQLFTDFKLHAEFRYPSRSNSGIYLRGRYELQIEDNFGSEADCHKIGGVYGFLTPSVNAARPAGQWQTFEITLVGRQLIVIHNDERIIDRQAIPGITGGALDSDEGQPGPILIQGDHGQVEFRKLTLTPVAGDRSVTSPLSGKKK